MSRLFNRVLIVVLLSYFSTSFAILELELTQGVSNAIPVVVMPFVGQEAIKSSDHKITSVVRNDLKNSGRFCLVETGNQARDKVDFKSWRAQKIEAVLMGKVKPLAGGQFIVNCRLLDVYNKGVLFEKEFTVKAGQLRKLAHHISDVAYQQLTGTRGVFSTKIAYILVERYGPRRAKHKLQVADSDGYNPRTLLSSSFPLMSPAWSPDGKQVAYVSFEGNRAAIYIQDLATGSRQILSKSPGINGAPAWSPDGKRMALVLTNTGFPKIYILDLNTKKSERITDGWSLDTEPNWAPDGKSLIFTSDRGGGPQIYRVYLDNQKIERVTYKGSYNARASFTSNGKGIVMLHREDDMFTIAHEDLSSNRLAILTQSGLNESPSVAPNGKMVIYATNQTDRRMLAEVSIDGSVKILLPVVNDNGAVQEPSWSPFLN